jgi:hypothetical protein
VRNERLGETLAALEGYRVFFLTAEMILVGIIGVVRDPHAMRIMVLVCLVLFALLRTWVLAIQTRRVDYAQRMDGGKDIQKYFDELNQFTGGNPLAREVRGDPWGLRWSFFLLFGLLDLMYVGLAVAVILK